jgi:glucose-6-phosphate 1-dehydrogenase
MPPQDDSDIKIFGATGDAADTVELLESAALLERQRNNGNIAKAKALGESLAELETDNTDKATIEHLIAVDEANPGVLERQVRALLVFLAQNTLSEKLITPLLSTCAVNAMYDKLIESSPEFYQSICDGVAATFYNLSLGRGDDVDTNIGESFAMLCGMEGDEVYTALGAKLYRRATDTIRNMIDECKFEDLN